MSQIIVAIYLFRKERIRAFERRNLSNNFLGQLSTLVNLSCLIPRAICSAHMTQKAVFSS